MPNLNRAGTGTTAAPRRFRIAAARSAGPSPQIHPQRGDAAAFASVLFCERVMRSPSIVPGFDSDVYLVLDDFGPIGRAYREVDEEAADREPVLRGLMRGEYNNPVRIVAFNTAEGWARDVTTDVAREIRDRGDELSPGLRDFIDNELDRARRLAALSARL